MIIFYELFANKENIEAKLNQLNLAEHERKHLLELLRKIYQQHLLAGILDLLGEEDQAVFLEKFYYGPELSVVNYLRERIEDLDVKISKLVSDLEIEIFTMLAEKK
ncbi:MAG: hypothetical protein A3F35_03440 [Candidatus Woykebacteria bacterium RIFCSPHIGHO2_12_FULL_45_10]|uniref:Uncharacterized protein n=1 Tax=Candidatus Woykebacteria bacterium RIFCSPHIGHO2_12_FULL_45_10 TaxID=1802603 RepID=A0A1G1WS17_9BACT|nr:MAG: hypothetical protein A3F35_03440 [Candidatus Woykebacteria bacterium RIFCSPHIGHO2_12_FULL_45_10]